MFVMLTAEFVPRCRSVQKNSVCGGLVIGDEQEEVMKIQLKEAAAADLSEGLVVDVVNAQEIVAIGPDEAPRNLLEKKDKVGKDAGLSEIVDSLQAEIEVLRTLDDSSMPTEQVNSNYQSIKRSLVTMQRLTFLLERLIADAIRREDETLTKVPSSW